MQAYVPQKWYSKDNTVTSPAVIYMPTRDISVLLVKQRVLLFYMKLPFVKPNSASVSFRTKLKSQRLVAHELKRSIIS